jgi:hypothetical protein
VNAITGTWCRAETDLVIHGAQPIVIQRILVDQKWKFFPNIQIIDSSSKEIILLESTGASIKYERIEKGEKFHKFIPVDLT